MPRGGKRPGARRPPELGETKIQKSVTLSPRAWAFVARVCLEQGCNESKAIEHIIRTHWRFVPEQEGNAIKTTE